jgi:protein O-GlcNAc transferase
MGLQELFNKAVELYKSGNTHEALAYCNQIIQSHPAFPDAFNLSGLIARHNKNYAESVKQFRRALQINDKSTVYLNNLGQSLLLLGKEEDAVKAFKKSLSIDPDFIPSLLQLGKISRNKNELDQAVFYFEKILEKKPNHIAALNNLGNVFQLLKKPSRAMELYSKAILLNPQVAELHFNLGNIFLLNGQLEEAETKFKESIRLNPAFHKPYAPLSQLYIQRQEFKKGKDCLLQSIKIFPDDSEALFLLANFYRSGGEIEEAVVYYKKAIKANPAHAMALNNLGMTYFSIGMTVEADDCYQKALLAAPDCVEAMYGMAKLKENEKKYEASCTFFENTLALKPPFQTQVLFDYFLLKLRIAKWDTYEEDIKLLKDRIIEYVSDDKQNFQLSPLTLNYFPIEQEFHKKVAEKYASLLVSQTEGIKAACQFSYPSGPKDGKIRIGYLSPDLRFHAVGMLLNQMFKHHDKTKFEIYAYSIINNGDEYNQQFKAGADVFRDITKLSHEEAAKLINKDQIQILIDLAGYTTYTRTQILALKPAPVQMHFMGYPDTMGADFIDYVIADKFLIPEQDKKYYTEEVAYIDHAFFSSPFKVSEKEFSRASLGLPEDAFVYCCYNSYHKISPDLFDTWMEILKRTENSVLWLTRENEIGAENMIKQAEKRGIRKDRIIFAERLPMDEYLASYRCADLFLDTFNYSAGSTGVCAIWGEVPVLTYAGGNNSARMGASIVHAAGLDDFICSSKEEYLTKAIDYSRQKEKIEAAKLHLKRHKMKLPLFDMQKAVQNMEELFQKILP